MIEVKDFSGWIYGDGSRNQWTKVMASGKTKYRFFNPIKQNNGHIASLRKQLKQFKSIPFFSVIVFYGDCELKEINYVPEGTYIVKAARLFEVLNIIKRDNVPAPYSNKRDVVNVFKKAVLNGENMGKQIKHVEDIKDMIGKHRIFK